MRIRHLFPSATSRHDVEGPRTFGLRNQIGDFLSFGTERQSRYEGWYVWQKKGFLKLVERIELVQESQVIGLTNTGSTSYWEYANGIKLGFKPLNTLSGFTVSASVATNLRIVLDVRGMYATPELGRTYGITQDEHGILIGYKDEQTKNVFLHIRSRGEWNLTQKWQQVDYPRDAARHSTPDKLYVFAAVETSTNLLSIGFGTTAAEAQQTSLAASKQRPTPPQLGINHTMDTLLNEVHTARACVNQSLRWLQSEAGMWAGLPWFHQVWSRDELITALGLNHLQQHEIIKTYLGHPLVHGELPTFLGSGTTCADGVGWFALLVREYGTQNLDEETRERLRHFLLRAYQGLRDQREAHHGLIGSGHNATWMDTIGRSGFRLEIQTMYALVLELLEELTGEPRYAQERLRFFTAIREHFWTGTHLADGLADPTIRPNVFLAYLLQPDLLSASLWNRCFDTALRATLTSWGGLTSLDKSDTRFQPISTGQDNLSYHNGDSWYFINNMTAVALARLNTHRYGRIITGILQSSTQEILWQNIVGHSGEIASASTADSWGCGIQAFSGGTYLWLISQLEGYSAGQGSEAIASFWDAAADSTSLSFVR